MKTPSLLLTLAIFIFAIKTQAQCWNINDSAYTMGFETSDMAKFANWTIVDSDANDTTWSITNLSPNTGDSSAVIKTYGNDWLFTSCMHLDSGVIYEIGFSYRRAYPYYKNQSILLTVGSTATLNTISDTVLKIDSIELSGYQKAYIRYTSQTTGNQVLGFYAYGKSNFEYTRLYIDDFYLNKWVCDTISIALGNDTTFKFCRYDSLLLGVNAGFANYQWSNSASTNNQLWVKEQGTYAVQVTHSNGCIGKDSIVVINDSITPQDITVSANQLTKCAGDSIALNALNTCTSYVWKNSSNTVINSDTSKIWVSSTGTYYLTVIDGYGCYGRDSIQVNNSTNSVSITKSKNIFCSNDSIGLIATTGFSSYNWNGDDSLSQTNQLYINTADTYFVIAKDIYNCLWSDTVVIADTAIIQAPHDTIISNKSIICINDSAIIQATVIDGLNSQHLFQWKSSHGVIDSIYSDTAIYAKSAGTYFVLITDILTGCWSYSSVPLLIAEPYSNQDICIVTVDSATKKNSIVWVKQDSLGIDAFKLYRENTQGVFESFATIDYNSTSLYTDTIANPQVRSYSYKITSIDTCGNESNVLSSNAHSTIHLSINPGIGGKYNLQWTPYVGFEFNTYKLYRDTSVNQNHPVLLDNVPTSINAYTDISPIAGVDNYYYVEVQRDSGCVINAKKKGNCINTSRSNVMSSQVLSVNDLKQQSTNINVYPNPFKESTNISYSLTKTEQVRIELCNILGETESILINSTQQQGDYNYQLINARLAEGVYFIRITIDNNVSNKRVIVIK